MAKTLLFDIECTHLKANFGTLLCFGYKWLDKPKVYCPTINGKTAIDDESLVRIAHEVLSSADIIVSYYGKGFDIPWLQAKFLEYGLTALPNIPHVDLFFTVKSNMAITPKSLANLSVYLNFKNAKTPVEWRVWKRAAIGDRKALKYIVEHCKSDVLLLEEAYYRLRPLVRTHPRVAGYGPCRACGSTRLHSRGTAVTTLVKPKRRIQCQNCGSWDLRPYLSVIS